MPRSHRVVAVLYDGFQPLDLSGPMEVLVGATRAGADPAYEFVTATTDGRPATSESGLRVLPDIATTDVDSLDTLMVVGGECDRAIATQADLLPEVRRLAGLASRVTSVCSGALVLAAAGLLRGRRATTHWTVVDQLAAHDGVTVDADRLYVQDGNVWTSAGVTAGIDLYLAILETDHGPDVANLIARHLVVFVHRPGGQKQFSDHIVGRAATSQPIRHLQRWIPGNLAQDLSLERLATEAGVSARTLSRRFQREIGTSPGAFVEEARIGAAKQLLETSDLTVATVAARVGFSHGETMHRAFVRRVGTTPAQYRNHFATPAKETTP